MGACTGILDICLATEMFHKCDNRVFFCFKFWEIQKSNFYTVTIVTGCEKIYGITYTGGSFRARHWTN